MKVSSGLGRELGVDTVELRLGRIGRRIAHVQYVSPNAPSLELAEP
jgi:hypothetical protein